MQWASLFLVRWLCAHLHKRYRSAQHGGKVDLKTLDSILAMSLPARMLTPDRASANPATKARAPVPLRVTRKLEYYIWSKYSRTVWNRYKGK